MDVTTILPYPLLLDIYQALIEPSITVNNFVPVFALAGTCKILYQVLHENRSIWCSLFAAKYDLHEHHRAIDFDLKRELQLRNAALKTTQKGPSGAALSIPSSAECQCRGAGGAFSVLVRIALENVCNNVKSLIHYRAHWHYSAFQLSYFTLRSSVINKWTVPVCQQCSNWLAFLEIVGLANTATFKMILRQRSIETVDWICSSFSENRSINLIAQVVHLKMIYLLAHRTRNKDIPMPQYSDATFRYVKGASFSPSLYLPQVLKHLAGQWTGYTSDDTEAALRLSFWIEQSTEAETVVVVRGNGRTFSGLARRNGEVDFTAVTEKGVEEQYLGFVLPWGIVGTVARPGSVQPRKLFWIWREV